MLFRHWLEQQEKRGQIDISKLWFTQRSLKRANQITNMLNHLDDGEFSERIELRYCPDGEIEINNGHHRVTAIWHSGRRHLNREEYTMIDVDNITPRFGRLGTNKPPPAVNNWSTILPQPAVAV